MGNPPVLPGIDFLTIKNRPYDSIFVEKLRYLDISPSSGVGSREGSEREVLFPQENLGPKGGGVRVEPPS